MKKAAKMTTPLSHAPSLGQSSLKDTSLGLQLLDMSWRVALPVLVLSIVSANVDRHFHTKPTFTICGLLLAITISSLLVYKQVAATYPDFFAKKGHKK